MLFKFKILNSEKDSKFLGMFGDCIKIRLLNLQNDLPEKIISFLAEQLCIEKYLVKIKSFDGKKSIAEVELPDPAYEIIMSWVE